MHLSVKGLAIAFALTWGGGIFFVGVVNLASPSYGVDFLRLVSSIYPGFHASRSFIDVVVGMLYGMVDGAVGGVVFGWLYNVFAGQET